MESVYIGIGANLNNPVLQVKQAIHSLSTLKSTTLVTYSSLYQSTPMGQKKQDDYINAVAKLTTELFPIELLDELQQIEVNQGRVRKANRWGPRIIDLDLLLYGNQVIESERLNVPHYGMKQRAFVLIPLAEIEPQLVFPDNDHLVNLTTKIGSQGILKLWIIYTDLPMLQKQKKALQNHLLL